MIFFTTSVYVICVLGKASKYGLMPRLKKKMIKEIGALNEVSEFLYTSKLNIISYLTHYLPLVSYDRVESKILC